MVYGRCVGKKSNAWVIVPLSFILCFPGGVFICVHSVPCARCLGRYVDAYVAGCCCLLLRRRRRRRAANAAAAAVLTTLTETPLAPPRSSPLQTQRASTPADCDHSVPAARGRGANGPLVCLEQSKTDQRKHFARLRALSSHDRSRLNGRPIPVHCSWESGMGRRRVACVMP